MVEENTGMMPKQFPVKKYLPEVKKELNLAKKGLEKIDKKRKG